MLTWDQDKRGFRPSNTDYRFMMLQKVNRLQKGIYNNQIPTFEAWKDISVDVFGETPVADVDPFWVMSWLGI